MSDSEEYIIWNKLKGRCLTKTDQRYHDYGGRGITIDPDFINDFMAFYREVGPRPSKEYSIDRIDNEKGYIKGNIKWSTALEQNRNTRRNRYFIINGQKKCLSEWCEIHNLSRGLVKDRLRLGWDIEKALASPPDKRFGPKTK